MHFSFGLNRLRLQLFVSILLPALLLLIATGTSIISQLVTTQQQNMLERGQNINRVLTLATSRAIQDNEMHSLQNLVQAYIQEADIAYITIKDKRDNILAQATTASEQNLSATQHLISTVYRQQVNAAELTTDAIGTVSTGLQAAVTIAFWSPQLISMLWIFLFCLIFAWLLTTYLDKRITRPIKHLTYLTGQLIQGNRVSIDSPSFIREIDILNNSFAIMADQVLQTQDYLNEQIDNAIKELTVAMAVLEEKNQSLQQSSQLANAQNETKTQFIAHISHEIRTPMNGIIGFTDLLLKSKLTPTQLEQAQLIKMGARNMLAIINEILDYSSLTTGNFRTEIKVLSIRECLEDAVTSIPAVSQETRLIVDVVSATPRLIKSDPVRIGQLVTNLVGNACKFTRSGRIIVRCCITRQSRLFVSVSDSGIGMDAETLNRLFKPFLQTSQYALNHELSTGLGLSITQNIIEKMGGSIGVRSRPGQGSKFWFELPVTCIPQQQAPIRSQIIALIDGMSDRRNALGRQLTHTGYRCQHFDDLNTYKYRAQQRPSLVIYAVPTALKTREEFNRELKRVSFVIDHIPVLLMQHPRQQFNFSHCFHYPCRTTFLDQLIQKTSDHLTTVSAVPFTAETEAVAHKVPGHFSVFIADDNQINRLLLKSQLEQHTHDIVMASDGQDALEHLHNRTFDLIFLDLQMPYYSGLEILKKIKQSGNANADTPVIAVTAHAQSSQRKRLIDAGFDECLIKPVLMEQIDEIIQLWTAESSLPDNKKQSNPFVIQLLEKTAQNKALTEELFKKLFVELPQQTQSIAAAIQIQDIEQASQITHKLHGSVSFCGFSELEDTAQALENALLAKDLDTCNTRLKDLQQLVGQFIAQREDIVDSLAACTGHPKPDTYS